MSTKPGQAHCLYARADTPITIEFRNLVQAQQGGGGINANIAIYPDQASAVSETSSGIQTRGKEQREAALFIGEYVQGPGTIVYSVPPLPKGTYYVQSDPTPFLLVATLVVS